MQVFFLLKHDPQALEEIMKLSDQLKAAQPTIKVKKETHFNEFAGMQLVGIFQMNRLRLIKQHRDLQKKSIT